MTNSKWEVGYSTPASKQKKALPEKIKDLLLIFHKKIICHTFLS